jgi:UDP-GlcNAc:undecaprenyl-phosphate/decaprenyl-phosphate GlcNAc-1-phosphate transferase
VTFLVALVVAAVLTPAAGWLGRALGLVDHPSGSGLKIHRASIPITGGLAVMASVGIALGVGGRSGWGGVLAAGAALVVGTVDDLRGLPALARVLGLAVAGAVLVLGTDSVTAAGLLGWVGATLLVVAVANAVNIADGQDGLVGGVGAVAALGLAVLSSSAGLSGATELGLTVGGALIGFLVWNRPPARVFLGNGGAYAVGTLLAAGAVRVVVAGGWRGFLAAGACLGPFAFELSFTVARRLRSRERLSGGDRLHSYDLVARTAGRTASTIVFAVYATLSVGVGLLIWHLPPVGITLAVVATVLSGLWGVLLWNRRPATT